MRRHRLTGMVEGVRRTYLLPPGGGILGKAAECDVVLPVRGVSRRHARLVADAGRLEVEDLASRNGTFVAGRRITGRRSLAVGEELRLGPVRLSLEEVEAGDDRLGLVLEPEARPGEHRGEVLTGGWVLPSSPGSEVPGAGAGKTTRWGEVTVGSFSLEVESLVTALAAGGPAAALGHLATSLGCRGAAVVEWPVESERGVVLAAWGECGPPEPAWLEPALTAVREAPAEMVLPVLAPDGAARGCLRGRPGTPVRGLLLWGGEVTAASGEALLRTVLRLSEVVRPPLRPPAGPASGGAPELRFPDGFVRGQSAAMKTLYTEMAAVAAGGLPVLLSGETGVGKEHLARALHASSERRDGPFVAVNCAAIPADLLEAEMFGVGKAVATGVGERRGRFELADGGTLLLDEVGELPRELQPKLLRALEEREIQPLGGPPRRVDVRIIAATNADLEARMEAGEFRRDLFYRLAGARLWVPPLRRRREDIPLLLEHFLRRRAAAAGKTLQGLTVRALTALCCHPWPGNVRELQHEVHRLVQRVGDGEIIDSQLLDPRLRPAAAVEHGRAGVDAVANPLHLESRVAALERQLIRQALEQSGGNRTRAAELLGISRQGLHLKLRRLGLGQE